MSSSLVLNSNPTEIRVALLDNGAPIELHVERRAERGVLGNIYRGKVVRVLPGMQAAFVDIGIERTAFLYVNDAVLPTVEAAVEPKPSDTDLDEVDATEGNEAFSPVPHSSPRSGFRQAPIADIEHVLCQGQELLVQVQKEPIGQKGARLTRHIAIPGRLLVFMPFAPHIGVSHRIIDVAERERLRAALFDDSAPAQGFIVRTAAEGVSESVLQREAQMLRQMWADILSRGSQGSVPRLVFEDFDLVLRVARDFCSDEIERIVCDQESDYERMRSFFLAVSPAHATRVELYDGRVPIFDQYGVEVEIARALDRRVWLKSGGYIVIDEAEALTAIDVNSGRFVGKSNLEDTITQINLEAVKEIAYQLRLRNIGGIVIIDFIDMTSAENRDKVLSALGEGLSRDRAKTTIVRMSEIGLVEMTRKRVRESLGHVLTEDCPYCRARGFVKSQATVANEVLRAIARTVANAPAARVLVNLSPGLADYLYVALTAEIERLEHLYETQIIPVAREGYHREHYEIVSVSS